MVKRTKLMISQNFDKILREIKPLGPGFHGYQAAGGRKLVKKDQKIGIYYNQCADIIKFRACIVPVLITQTFLITWIISRKILHI